MISWLLEPWQVVRYWFAGQREPENLAWDVRWGTESATFTVRGYEPSLPSVQDAALDALDIRPEDWTFVDLGSGKGRAVFIASQRPFKSAVGIELDARLHAIALDNLRIFTERGGPVCPVELIHGDAALATLPDGPLIIYLFNPFPSWVLREVLDRVRDRKHRVVYVNPLDAKVVEAEGFVEQARSIPREEGAAIHVTDWRIYTT